jgi:dihydropyrimidinase
MRASKLVIGGSIRIHMELPFGGTQSATILTGRAAAFGGTTTIIDFAVQTKGESMISGVDSWHKKAEGKCAIDYGFHLITTDFEDKHTEEMYTLMDEGITSFKLFMAYPGVFLADDATIFRAMSAAGQRGGLICMHAENGIVINEIIKRFLADGRTARYHAPLPTIAEAEAHRAIAIAEMAESPVYIVHLSLPERSTKSGKTVSGVRRNVRSICFTRSTITAMTSRRTTVMTPPARNTIMPSSGKV